MKYDLRGHKRSHKVTFYFVWTTFVHSLFLVGGLVYDELGEGEEEGMDDINDDVSTQETICPEDGDDRKVDS